MFQDYADDSNDEVVSAAIQGIGECSNKIPETTSNCLKVLIPMVKSPYGMPLVCSRRFHFIYLGTKWDDIPSYCCEQCRSGAPEPCAKTACKQMANIAGRK